MDANGWMRFGKKKEKVKRSLLSFEPFSSQAALVQKYFRG